MEPPTFTLPDFAAHWPFKRTQNPHYNEELVKANSEWMTNLNLLQGKAQIAFEACDFPLFVSLIYPKADALLLRLSLDYMDWCFFLDELGDPLDRKSYEKLTAGVMDVLRDPDAQRDRELTGIEELTKSFWSRCLEIANPLVADRFVDRMQKDLDAICQEAEDRARGYIRPVEDYLALRRHTSGVEPCFHFLVLSSGLPDNVWNHPIIQELNLGSMDMIILSNDVYSYNFERSRGIDDHNMVTAVMKEKGIGIQESIDYIGNRWNAVAGKFLHDMKRVPSFGPEMDKKVEQYVWGLGNWVVGYLEWTFESKRYFGKKGLEIKKTRVVELSPKSIGGDKSRETWSTGI